MYQRTELNDDWNGEWTDLTLESHRHDQDNRIPEYIRVRTMNILGSHPMTNQNLVLDTACWWFHVRGNCPIYRWIVHHLDVLESGEKLSTNLRNQTLYDEAVQQAQDIGMDPLKDE